MPSGRRSHSDTQCNYVLECANQRDCMHCTNNYLGIKSAYVLNIHMKAPNSENICTVLGLEFRDDFGKSDIQCQCGY